MLYEQKCYCYSMLLNVESFLKNVILLIPTIIKYNRLSTFRRFFYIVYRVLRITDHDALRNTGRRRVKLDDPAHKSEIFEEAVQRVQ